MKLKHFLKAINYEIDNGSEYLWKCFGNNAYLISGFIPNKCSATIIFDRKKETVYQVEFWNDKTDKVYRWTNLKYSLDYALECLKRNIKDDTVDYINLNSDKKILRKIRKCWKKNSN